MDARGPQRGCRRRPRRRRGFGVPAPRVAPRDRWVPRRARALPALQTRLLLAPRDHERRRAGRDDRFANGAAWAGGRPPGAVRLVRARRRAEDVVAGVRKGETTVPTRQARAVQRRDALRAVSYTHLRAHETVLDLVCR